MLSKRIYTELCNDNCILNFHFLDLYIQSKKFGSLHHCSYKKIMRLI